MSLKLQTANGIKWLASASILEKIIQTCTTIVLARILEPADFGLFALAFVAMRSMNLFRSFGFDSALIQRKDDVESAAHTAFCVIASMGVVIFIILNVFAPFLARFFNNAALEPIIKVLGLVFVLSAVSRVPSALLEKSMRFNRLAIIDVVTAVMFSILAISLAVNGWGVLSLVYAYVFKIFCRMCMILWASGWRPRLLFHKKIATEMYHFGKYRFADGLVGFFSNNTDNIIIGKFLGVTLLGYYALAFNLANFLGRYIMNKIGRVLFPAFTKLQDDDSNLRRIYLRSVMFLSLLSLPFATLIFLYASEIVHIVYGAKWAPAVPIVQILAVGNAIGIVGSGGGPVLLAKGRSKEPFLINLTETVLFVPIAIGLIMKLGLIGAASALVIARMIRVTLNLYVISKVIHLNVLRVFSQLRLSFYCSAAMVVMTIVIRHLPFVPSIRGIEQIVTFGSQLVFVAGAFIGTMFLVDKSMIFEIRNLILSRK